MKRFNRSALVCVISVIISSPIVAVIEKPMIAFNGNSDLKQNLTIGFPAEITCTAEPNYVVSILQIQRDNRLFHQVLNPVGNRITHDINISCKDNAQFRCYSRLNGTIKYSTTITVNVPCPPTPDKIEPIEYVKQSGAINFYYDFNIRGNPKLTFTGMKVTPQGPVSLSSAIWIQLLGKTGFRLYFHNYTDKEYGTYLIKAENIHGVFTANLTYRGQIANPTNLVAWSTSPNSIHLKFRAGEILDVAVPYAILYWINGETSAKTQTVKDVGDTITVTLNSLKPETTYNIFVQARHPKYRNSLYSNAATVTTINQGDPPQQEPVNSPDNVPPTTPLTSCASPVGSTSTKHSTSSTSPTGPTDLGFGAGIGIGLGVGMLIAITAVIVTVVYFRNRHTIGEAHVKDTSPQQYQDGEEIYENVPETLQQNYDVLRHKNTGARYNAAYNKH